MKRGASPNDDSIMKLYVVFFISDVKSTNVGWDSTNIQTKESCNTLYKKMRYPSFRTIKRILRVYFVFNPALSNCNMSVFVQVAIFTLLFPSAKHLISGRCCPEGPYGFLLLLFVSNLVFIKENIRLTEYILH